jgi:ACR3 family arsenite transporter
MTNKKSPIGIFERYLSLWVGLCILLGVFLGYLSPDIFQFIASLEYASVNLVVAIFITPFIN